MRVWDIKPRSLCRQHLLGEHREIHAIWSVITKSRKGYSNHPETLRWRGKLKALYLRHELLVNEIERRKYKHKSPLNKNLAIGRAVQKEFLHTPREQTLILKRKGCGCRL